MVETISAAPLPQGSGTGSAAQLLEPGTELKARVESNLPGGVVRLATADAKIDLRVSTPLPANAEVTVTVSGSRQQPAILIRTDTAPPPSAQQAPPQGQGAQPPQPAGQLPVGQPSQAGSGSAVVRPVPPGAHLVQVLSASAGPQGTGGPAAAPASPAPAAGPAGAPTAGPSSGQAPPSGAPQAPPADALLQAGTVSPRGPAGVPVTQATGTAGALPGQAPANTLGTPSSGTGTAPAGSPGQAPPSAAGPGAQTASLAPAGQQGAAVQPGSPQAAAGTGVQGAQGAQVPAPSGASALPSGAVGATAASAVTGGAANPATPASGPAGQLGSVPGPLSGSAGAAVSGSVAAAPLQPAAVPGAAPASTTNPQPLPALATGTAAPLAAASTLVSHTPGSQAPGSLAPGSLAQAARAPGTAMAAPVPASTGAAAAAPQTGAAAATGPGLSPGANQTRPSAAFAYPQLGGAAVSTSGAGSVSGMGPQGPAAGIAGGLQKPLSEQQAGLTGLFAQVGSLMSAQSAGKVSMPDTVVKAMQQILGLRLNASSPPTATSLQQAVRLSGQFREAHLAQPGSSPSGMPDLKSALLSFKSLLQQLGARSEIVRPAGQPQAPSRHAAPQGQAPQAAGGYWAGAAPQNLQALLKETNSALARLRITQLANTGLTQDSGPQPASKPMDLVLEMPLALGQETAVMQMQIGRDGAGNREDGEGDPAWRLRFALDLTATGPLEAAVSLRGGGTYASLWVDRKETFDMLNAVRDTMEAAFADAGLDLQELRLIRGLPPRAAAPSGARVDRQS